MPARRSRSHRIALWLAGGTLALTLYVASYPLAFEWSKRSGWGRFTYPVVQAVYYPLAAWVRQPDSFGNAAYLEYANWIFYHLNEPEFGNAESNARLGVTLQVDFTAASLRDVVQFLNEAMAWPIELDPDVNADVEVTLNSSGPLRDVLKQILEPLGLIAWPSDGRIAIGTPAAIELVRVADRARHPFPTGGYVLLTVSAASAISLAILLHRGQRPITRPSTAP